MKKEKFIFATLFQSLFLRLGVLGFVGMWACKTNDPLATPMPNTDYSIIDGDTVKTVVSKDYKKIKEFDTNIRKYILVGDTIATYKEPKLHTPPGKDPDLTKVKNEKEPTLKGKPLTMIVVGGSMSAGVRDGGYFNEGILTSYPNLIARQMKLKKFEQPLFDANQYNGIGKMVKTSFNPTGGPIQKFNFIQNNLASEFLPDADYDFKKIKLPNYKGDADNLSVPFNSRYSIGGDGTTSAFSNRIILNKDKDGNSLSTTKHLKGKKFDFFIVESGIDDFIEYVGTGAGAIWTSNVSESAKDYTFQDSLSFEQYQRIQPELRIIREVFAPLGAKGVFLNIPDILELPYFLNKDYVLNYDLLVKQELLKQNYLSLIKKFKPSSKIDSLLSKKVNIALKPVFNLNNNLISEDVVNDGENRINLGLERLNNQLINFNKKYGYGIVDIKSLYKKILSSNGLIADDGSLINRSNFFSLDGINPTPLGQAVIANEVIKTINFTYKTEIPLIPVRTYLNIK